MLKKLQIKSWFLMLCMILGVGNAWAEEAVFDFASNPWNHALGSGSGSTAEVGNLDELTSGDATITFGAGTNQTPPRYWTGPQVRVYNGNILTFSADGYVITKVELTSTGANYQPASANVWSTEGKISATETTWEGEAETVTLTGDRTWRLTKIVVTYEIAGSTDLEENDLELSTTSLTLDLSAGTTSETISYSSSSNGAITWTSSDESVATVEDGVVTAVAVGAATITANQAKTDTYKAGIATCEVTIINSEAPEEHWILADISELSSGDVIAVVDNNSLRALYNGNAASSAPTATTVTIENDEITSSVPANLQWIITKDENSLKFNVSGTENYLYCTNANNGVRVGTNSNNNFEIKDKFLYNTATSRYLGVYNNQDWRCYTTIGDNIKDTKIAFYKHITGTVVEKEESDFLITSSTTLELEVGDESTVTYTTSSEGTITWTSDNESVATVANGVITAVGPGEAVISVKQGADDNYKASETFEISVNVSGTLESIAELVSKAAGEYSVKLDNAVVTYVNGKYAYIQDETGAIQYFKDGHGLEAGQILNGTADVTLNFYYNNPQLTALSGVTPENGEVPNPEVIAVSDWNTPITAVLSKFIKITGATITQNGNNYFVQLGEENVQLYRRGDLTAEQMAELDLSATYSIVGFPTVYNTTPELTIFVLPETEGDGKQEAGLAYETTEFDVNLGEPFTAPNLTNPYNLTVTYTSSNEDVATVDENGAVTIVAGGSVTITATFIGNDTYKAGEASYTIKVKDPSIVAGEYELVNDAATLKAGDEIVFGYIGTYKTSGTEYETAQVMSTEYNSTNNIFGAIDMLSHNDNIIEIQDGTAIITLGGSIGAWTFQMPNGTYLVSNGRVKDEGGSGIPAKNENIIETTEDNTDTHAQATIEIDSDGNATVLFQGGNGANHLYYNVNSGKNQRFSCYSAKQTGLQIYRKVASDEPEFLKGDVTNDKQISIADVTALVNIILGKATPESNPEYNFEAAKVTDDDEISIADVTALVNIILGKQ